MRWLLALCLMLMPLTAWAEAAYVQVYLSEADALKQVFPAGVTVTRREIKPTAAQRTSLERHLGRRLTEPSYTFFVGQKGKQLDAYAMVLDEIGKHDPITFIVGINPDLSVREVAVMVFRERRGDGVRRRRFLTQFPGKTEADQLMLNRDIMPLTGSTLSSVAVAAGVKRALAMTKVLVLGRPL